jgi:hypothetical protein
MAPVSEKEEKSSSSEDAATDVRGGSKFGGGVGYEDAFSGGGGGVETEYVSELPTAAEEEEELNDRRQEDEQVIDQGRVSSHPSTMAASRRTVSTVMWKQLSKRASKKVNLTIISLIVFINYRRKTATLEQRTIPLPIHNRERV